MNCNRPGCTRGGLLKRGMCGSCYATWRNRQIAYGRFQSDYIDAAPARAHIQRFRELGLSWQRISELTGVHRIPQIGTGRTTTIRRGTAERILSTPVPASPRDAVGQNGYIPAIGAARRLQALIANGWAQSELAELLDAEVARISDLVHGKQEFVTADRYRSICDLFDKLQLVPGSSKHARTVSVKHGWALPLEWDEELIDDPTAQPIRARRTRRDNVYGPMVERREKVRELTERGLSAGEIAARLGVSERQIVRDRSAA